MLRSRSRGFIIIAVCVMLVALVGCTAQKAEEKPVAIPAETPAEAPADAQVEPEAPLTITVVHELGEVTIDKNPSRVIVFDYATLDSLDQMGVDIIGLPKSNVPAYLSHYNDDQYEDVGTLFEPNFESIYELQPDVIFISARQSSVYEELNKIAPTIYLTIDAQDYMGSFSHNLSLLGDIFEKEAFVESELSKINESIENVYAKVSQLGKNALIVMANDGALSVYGKGSRFNIVHGEFGFEQADAGIEVSNHGQSISFEYLVDVNPDIMFVIDRAMITGGSDSAEKILDNALVHMTKAYQEETIYYLNAHVWYVASGGLQGTQIMIEDVSKALE